MQRVNLSIDVGAGLAAAAWDMDTWFDLVYPVDVFLARVKDTTPSEIQLGFAQPDRVAYVAGIDPRLTQLEMWLANNKLKPINVYFELPTHMAGGEAAERTDSIVKLAMAAGAIIGWCHSQKIPPIPVAVNKWKGNTGKKITKYRVLKRLPEIVLPVADHAWDSVGIGLYVKGHYGD